MKIREKKVRKRGIAIAAMLCAALAGCGNVSVKRAGRGDFPLQTAKENPSTAEEEELFNSMGVAVEILSEGAWLSQEEHDCFLEKYGFSGRCPFYQYQNEDAGANVELYYDPDRNVGCGFRYWENTSGPVVCGYAFNQCETLSWYDPDPFSCVSAYGTTGKEWVTDYREEYEYDEEGKLTGFCSVGKAEEDSPDDPPASLISISFLYDQNGVLKERVYSHNSGGRYPFGTFLSSQHSYYDEKTRLLYTRSYITSGSLDSYFIYENDADTPSYYFELNNQYSSWPTLYRIQQNQDNWTWVELEQEPKEGYISEEEFMTEEEWLAYQDYTEENLFYEYEYFWEGAQYGITLYCDEKKERGGGILRESSETMKMRKYAFTFQGRERYLTYPIGPWNVFSEFYTDGRHTVFLQGETITEYFAKLEEEWGEYYARFGYEEDKLMYMEEERPHGGIWRFYIYEEDAGREPGYLLEVDPGWGVTFHSF